MTSDSRKSVVLVGAGNVATHLARALGQSLTAVISRNKAHADIVAAEAGVMACDDFGVIASLEPDIILISVADKAIESVVNAIGPIDYSPLVLHTSGTIGMEALAPISQRTGVLYPLQTFSSSAEVDMSVVPFFTESSFAEGLQVIDELALTMSRNVHHADAGHRRVLHIAGVFTSNFTNILIECVERILKPENYPLDVVKPLLEATVAKAFAVGPHAAQTGPARRGDFAVIERQEHALPDELRPVYRTLTDLILQSHNITDEQN